MLGSGLRWSPGDFSRHALCTAIAAEVLAGTTERLDPQVAYTAGLVCDLGKLTLAHNCHEFYPAVRTCVEQTQCTWEQAERNVLGYHHADAGVRLLKAWTFPTLFIQAVEHQFQPATARPRRCRWSPTCTPRSTWRRRWAPACWRKDSRPSSTARS